MAGIVIPIVVDDDDGDGWNSEFLNSGSSLVVIRPRIFVM